MNQFVYKICDTCGGEFGYEEGRDSTCPYPVCKPETTIVVKTKDKTAAQAQLSPSERPIVWEHPVTGELRYPGRNDGSMPKYYAEQGYQKKEFTSYHEHQKFCKEKELVNHKVEGIRDSDKTANEQSGGRM
jgi:hypothetical protein